MLVKAKTYQRQGTRMAILNLAEHLKTNDSELSECGCNEVKYELQRIPFGQITV